MKLGMYYIGKGSKRKGPSDQIGDEGPHAHGAVPKGCLIYCKVDIEKPCLVKYMIGNANVKGDCIGDCWLNKWQLANIIF